MISILALVLASFPIVMATLLNKSTACEGDNIRSTINIKNANKPTTATASATQQFQQRPCAANGCKQSKTLACVQLYTCCTCMDNCHMVRAQDRPKSFDLPDVFLQALGPQFVLNLSSVQVCTAKPFGNRTSPVTLFASHAGSPELQKQVPAFTDVVSISLPAHL